MPFVLRFGANDQPDNPLIPSRRYHSAWTVTYQCQGSQLRLSRVTGGVGPNRPRTLLVNETNSSSLIFCTRVRAPSKSNVADVIFSPLPNKFRTTVIVVHISAYQP